ncbi:hypothetical protein Ancab_024176 [Ancistrocladus abbreviatus]
MPVGVISNFPLLLLWRSWLTFPTPPQWRLLHSLCSFASYLQRITAWRESKKLRENGNNNVERTSTQNEQLELGLGFSSSNLDSSETVGEVNLGGLEGKWKEGLMKKEIELVHPWPEWIELMERLVQQNYFDHTRKDEDKMIEGLGFHIIDVVEEGFDFSRDWKTVQTAALNFDRDRFDVLRSLSRQDIQALVGLDALAQIGRWFSVQNC